MCNEGKAQAEDKEYRWLRYAPNSRLQAWGRRICGDVIQEATFISRPIDLYCPNGAVIGPRCDQNVGASMMGGRYM
jgi:hypothetical protein